MHDDNKFFKNLSAIIKFHRKTSGLTQIQLAELAGVGKTAIFDLEHGKQTVQLNTLLSVLKILNISIEFNSPLMPILNRDNDETS